MSSSPISGASYLLKGFGLIIKPSLLPFVVIPLLINIALFGTGTWWLAGEFSQILDKWLPDLPSWLEWLESLIWIVFAVLVLVTVFYTFTLIANLISSPFNSVLAEKTELLLTGKAPAFDEPIARQVVRAIKSELVKLTYMATRMIILAIISIVLFFIPVVNAGIPVMWFMFSAWLLSIEYLDYPLGNHGQLFKQIRQYARQRRAVSLGFGSAVTIASSIPLVNLLVMPAAVAGATQLVVDQRSTELK